MRRVRSVPRLLGLGVVACWALASVPASSRPRPRVDRDEADAPTSEGPTFAGRCLESMVRIEVSTPFGTISGSGTVIDPRGYVLTNFHVVGHLHHESGTPGVHHDRRFRVAPVRSPRESVVDEFEAEVVRGHVQLDLALLRVVSRAGGAPLGETRFVANPPSREVPRLGERVWALGFPIGIRTINTTAGQIAGFDENTLGEVSWLRTDTEFNPGNSGGALVDQRCQLLGVPTAMSEAVEPIELARPSARLPAAWLEDLARGGELTPQPTEGLRELTTLVAIDDEQSGDVSPSDGELRYFRLPAARPGIVTVSPRLEIGLIGSGGRIVRLGTGELLVTASDAPTTLVGVAVPRSQGGDSPSVELRYTPMRPTDRPRVEGRGQPVRGAVTRAEGRACTTYAALFPAGTDVAARVAEVRAGRAPEAALVGDAVALGALDNTERFELAAAAGRYELAILGPHGAEHTATVDVLDGGLSLPPIALASRCR